jgi:CubicO group peptidase (beta-lactamase class C family)|tara:strand:- start:26094 stop:27257 length:1164 start_codon:yes stop_codon:yes gene_type:complete
MSQIHGEVAPGFERVKDAFTENFEQHGDVGAACSVYHRGKMVVDRWGGVADEATGQPWAEDGIIVVASSTKGATAICANLLAQRGELDLDAPVAQYWPEFAAGGKQDVPVRWLLSHRVGLPVLDKPLTIEEFLAWEPPVAALAAQTPKWTPGTAHGYHAITYGWLVGEVVRRITGKSLGTFFAEEVAGPLGLDFWIGLPANEEHRVLPMIEVDLEDPTLEPKGERAKEMLAAATTANSYLTQEQTTSPLDMGSRAFHAAELPAANGITDARSMARMYASLVGKGVDGVRLFTDKTVKQASTEQSGDVDQVMGIHSRFGTGFYLYMEGSNMIQDGVFGHGGAGGSIGYADPKADIGFGYVMNKMQMVGDDDPRTVNLAQAVHDSIANQ